MSFMNTLVGIMKSDKYNIYRSGYHVGDGLMVTDNFSNSIKYGLPVKMVNNAISTLNKDKNIDSIEKMRYGLLLWAFCNFYHMNLRNKIKTKYLKNAHISIYLDGGYDYPIYQHESNYGSGDTLNTEERQVLFSKTGITELLQMRFVPWLPNSYSGLFGDLFKSISAISITQKNRSFILLRDHYHLYKRFENDMLHKSNVVYENDEINVVVKRNILDSYDKMYKKVKYNKDEEVEFLQELSSTSESLSNVLVFEFDTNLFANLGNLNLL